MRQMREINHLRRKTWEKVRKGGLEVGKAGPFSHLLPAFSHFDPSAHYSNTPPLHFLPIRVYFVFHPWLNNCLIRFSRHNAASRAREAINSLGTSSASLR